MLEFAAVSVYKNVYLQIIIDKRLYQSVCVYFFFINQGICKFKVYIYCIKDFFVIFMQLNRVIYVLFNN